MLFMRNRFHYLCVLLTVSNLGQQSVQAEPKIEVQVPVSYVLGKKSVTSIVHVPIVVDNGVVEVRVGDTANDMPLIPAKALSAALKLKAKANSFKLTWGSSGVHYGLTSALVYDRKGKTTKLYNSGYDGKGNSYKKYGNYALFTNVTDKVIQRWSGTIQGVVWPTGTRNFNTASQSSANFLVWYGATLKVSKKW